MNEFTYACPVKTYFGKGCMNDVLASEIQAVGKNVLLAYGGGSVKKSGVYAEIFAILNAAGKNIFELPGIPANPVYVKVHEGAKICREHKIEFILAVGGGSVVDCCKIISAQAKLDEDIWEYECVKKQVPSAFIPMGAVLTAFGTGSEQNNSGVITNYRAGEKRSLKGAYPLFAVIDINCSKSLPQDLLMAGAFDTFSHCMETYFSLPNEIVVSDEINEAVMRNLIKNMCKIKHNPEDDDARSELAWDSALAMNGILKAGKKAAFQAHQIDHQLGAYTNCTHGKGLAVIQPAYYLHTYKGAVEKFAKFARDVWGLDGNDLNDDEMALKGIEKLRIFIKKVGLPVNFRELGGISKDVIDKVSDTTFIMDTSCKKLTREVIAEILEDCI